MSYAKDCLEFRDAFNGNDTEKLKELSVVAFGTYSKLYGDFDKNKVKPKPKVSGDLNSQKGNIQQILYRLTELGFVPTDEDIKTYALKVPDGNNMYSRILGWTLEEFKICEGDLYKLINTMYPEAEVDPRYGVDTITMFKFLQVLFAGYKLYVPERQIAKLTKMGVPENKIGEVYYATIRSNGQYLVPRDIMNTLLSLPLETVSGLVNLAASMYVSTKVGALTINSGNRLAGKIAAKIAEHKASGVATDLAVASSANVGTSALGQMAVGIAVITIADKAVKKALEVYQFRGSSKLSSDDVKKYMLTNWGGYGVENGVFVQALIETFSSLFVAHDAIAGEDYKLLAYEKARNLDIAEELIETEIDELYKCIPVSSKQNNMDKYRGFYEYADMYF